ISMVAVVSAIIMCFALAGCSKSVKGNTYVFDDIKIEGTIPEEAKEYIEEMIAETKEMMAGVEVKFNDDGTYVATKDGQEVQKGYYKQDGKKVYVAGTEEGLDAENLEYYVVDGSKLVLSESEDGLTIKMVYKKK
ncbi:MAG: hypothetical protein K2O41_01630, partial [Clostridia bacterium]|nr:hypothetical protein [Clostridia bacterium]